MALQRKTSAAKLKGSYQKHLDNIYSSAELQAFTDFNNS